MLTTDDLIALNKSADVDRKDAAAVAKEYADEQGHRLIRTPHPRRDGTLRHHRGAHSENCARRV